VRHWLWIGLVGCKHLFEAPQPVLTEQQAPWHIDITEAAVDPASAEIIRALQDAGWGSGDFQLDWSLEVLEADADTPRLEFEPTEDFYSPDCDAVAIPVPADGNVEGEDGYACLGDGDCHLLVHAAHEERLYEMWRADLRGDVFEGGCLAVWDTSIVYPPDGRGEQCTSADAAGYPIAPLLFTADEVAAGAIDHAIRFAVPNDLIDDDVFYAPATHATTAGDDGPLPYGARLRLRADFDDSRIADPDALVIVRALQKYGMFLADGGNIPLMGESDRRATAKWDQLLEDGSHALFGIEPQDFELLELQGPPVPLTLDCVRNGL
jgi:hypothetical protein